MKKLILTILLILALWSCGTRKVQKSTLETKKEVATETAITENKATEKQTQIANDFTATETIIEPIDTAKVIEIIAPDGRVTKYKNARLSHKNTTDKSKVAILEKKQENKAITQKQAVKEVSKQLDKTVVKTTYSWYWWFLLLIPIAYGGYWVFRKYIKVQSGGIV